MGNSLNEGFDETIDNTLVFVCSVEGSGQQLFSLAHRLETGGTAGLFPKVSNYSFKKRSFSLLNTRLAPKTAEKLGTFIWRDTP